MTQDAIRKRLLSQGWCQGACISLSVVLEVLDDRAEFVQTKLALEKLFVDDTDAYLVAVMSSCDIVFEDLNNLPQTEFQLLRQKKTKGTNKRHSDPRYMILTVNGVKHRACMPDTVMLPRCLLLDLKPNFILDNRDTNSLVRWKASHYNRLALPEALVGRIGSCLRSKAFNDFITANHEQLEGVYFEVSPLRELEDRESYDIGVIVIPKELGIPMEKQIELETELESAFLSPLRDIEGINLLNDSEYEAQQIDNVMVKQRVSFELLERFRKYHLDHYSLDPEFNDKLHDLD